MPLPDTFLHKDGPLARVWLAAHWDRKLSKSQLLQTHIPSGVDVLVEDDDDYVTLRLSGQLLYGFARIYSRKAKYFQDDCADALMRIQVAFRGTAAVDLAQDQLHASRAAITLPDTSTTLNLLLPEPSLASWGLRPSRGATVARMSDITLPASELSVSDDALPAALPPPTDVLPDVSGANFDLGLVDDDVPAVRYRHGSAPKKARRTTTGSTRDAASAYTLPDAADAAWDDSVASVGVARHAPLADDAAAHAHAMIGDVDLSADLSLDPLPDLSLGAPPEDAAAALPALPGTPPDTAGPARASTPWRSSTPPRALTWADVAQSPAPLTPRTAAKLRSAAEQRLVVPAKAPRKRPMLDDVTEMMPAHARSLQARSAAVAATMSTQPHEQHCLPASRLQLALMAAKPATLTLPNSLAMAWGAAPGMAPARWAPTADTRRAWLSTRTTPAERSAEQQHWLREIHEQAQAQCINGDYSMEVARRASEPPAAWWAPNDVAPEPMALDAPAKPLADIADESMADESMAPELPPLEPMDVGADTTAAAWDAPPDTSTSATDAPRRDVRRSSRHARDDTPTLVPGELAPLSRLGTPDLDTTGAVHVDVPASNPLAAFETHVSETSSDGWDLRTKRAAHVLRTTMAEHGDDSVSFHALAQHASRRAAAGFFFEMLVLGTRNCVRLEQAAPYADLQVHARPALRRVA